MKFKEYLNLDKSNVNSKLSKQASVIFDVGYKIEVLTDELSRLDLKIELTESRLYRNATLKYKDLKNITSTKISHDINCNEEMIELKNKRLELAKALGIAKLQWKVLDKFTDLLINFSHNVREERKATNIKKT